MNPYERNNKILREFQELIEISDINFRRAAAKKWWNDYLVDCGVSYILDEKQLRIVDNTEEFVRMNLARQMAELLVDEKYGVLHKIPDSERFQGGAEFRLYLRVVK